jgi:peptide/nickel transport system permease protein
MSATAAPRVGPGVPETEESWEVPDISFAVFVRRLRTNAPLLLGGAMLLVFGGVALAALAVYGGGLGHLATDPNVARAFFPPGPSLAHPFGWMNGIGVEILSALFQATPFDLAVVGGALSVALFVGVVLGAYAGFDAGLGDTVVTVAGDLMVGIPPFFLVMVLFLGIQPFISASDDLLAFGLLFALVLWPYYARPVRARAQAVAHESYVEAARASGAGPARLLWRHVVPNSLFPVLAQIPVDVYNIFFVLTVFPFLACFGGGAGGFFAPLSPLPSSVFPEWGLLLASGACYGFSILPELNHWWMYVFPLATILLFGLAVTLTCDGVERFLRVSRT